MLETQWRRYGLPQGRFGRRDKCELRPVLFGPAAHVFVPFKITLGTTPHHLVTNLVRFALSGPVFNCPAILLADLRRGFSFDDQPIAWGNSRSRRLDRTRRRAGCGIGVGTAWLCLCCYDGRSDIWR